MPGGVCSSARGGDINGPHLGVVTVQYSTVQYSTVQYSTVHNPHLSVVTASAAAVLTLLQRLLNTHNIMSTSRNQILGDGGDGWFKLTAELAASKYQSASILSNVL